MITRWLHVIATWQWHSPLHRTPIITTLIIIIRPNLQISQEFFQRSD